MEMIKTRRFSIYPVAVLSMFFWGMSYIWTTIVFRYYNPITTIFLRLIISTIILSAFIFMFRRPEKIKKEDRSLLLLSALFNPFLYFLGENFGLKFSTPTISSVIIATIPVFVSIIGYLYLKERLSVLNIAGIIISFVGIGVMLINPDFTFKSPLKGIMFLNGAVISAVIYSILLKKLAQKYSALTIITWQNFIGIFYFLPVFLIFDLDNFLVVRPNFELISALVQLSLFASSLAFIFFTMTVKELGISRASVFTNLIPVVTAIFSFIFISEEFTPAKITGIAMVIMGVMVAQIRKKVKA